MIKTSVLLFQSISNLLFLWSVFNVLSACDPLSLNIILAYSYIMLKLNWNWKILNSIPNFILKSASQQYPNDKLTNCKKTKELMFSPPKLHHLETRINLVEFQTWILPALWNTVCTSNQPVIFAQTLEKNGHSK